VVGMSRIVVGLCMWYCLIYCNYCGNTKVRRRKSFKDVYQVTEIVVDNAVVGQMTSLNGLG